MIQDLKQFLLGTGFFEENDYFEQYLQLVTAGSDDISGYTERHHVLPVAYYRLINNISSRAEARKLANADSQNRLSVLTRRDHCLAHCLLYFCTVGELKQESATTVMMFTKKLKDFPELSDTSFVRLQEYINKIQNDPNNCYFTATEDNFLIENYNLLGVYGCAAALDRPIGSISVRAKYLNLKSNILYTEDQKDFIRKHYPVEGASFCATHLNRSVEAIQKYAEKTLQIKGRTRDKRIYCVELDKVFKSAVEASNILQICRTSICNALNGHSKMAGGYHWKFYIEGK